MYRKAWKKIVRETNGAFTSSKNFFYKNTFGMRASAEVVPCVGSVESGGAPVLAHVGVPHAALLLDRHQEPGNSGS